jgi:hypothetical protein
MESIKSVGGDAAKNRLVKKNELKEIVRRHNNVKNELESSFLKNLLFKVYNFEFSNYLDLKDVNRIERTVLHHE